MIRWVCELGLSQTVYTVFQGMGLLAMVIFNLHRSKLYGFSRWKGLAVTAGVFLPVYFWMRFLAWAETGFENSGYVSIVRSIVYIPLIIYAVGKLMKTPWKTLCDFFIPGLCLMMGISYFGCVFAGCCNGYECAWGIYNGQYHQRMFPVQFLDILLAALIFAGLLWRSRQMQYQPDGFCFL